MATKRRARGAEPLLAETPSVTIQGVTYPLRHLGLADVFKLAKIVSVGATGLGMALPKFDLKDDPEVIGKTVTTLLVAGLPYAEDIALDLFASIVGVKPEVIRDPEVFPMASLVDIVHSLAKHEDLLSFFGKLGLMMQGMSIPTSTQTTLQTDLNAKLT